MRINCLSTYIYAFRQIKNVISPLWFDFGESSICLWWFELEKQISFLLEGNESDLISVQVLWNHEYMRDFASMPCFSLWHYFMLESWVASIIYGSLPGFQCLSLRKLNHVHCHRSVDLYTKKWGRRFAWILHLGWYVLILLKNET